jgi:hypothetical protein
VVAVELIATPMAPGISDGLGQWRADGIDKATPLAPHERRVTKRVGRPVQFKVFKRKARLTSTRSAHRRWCVLSRCPLCNR